MTTTEIAAASASAKRAQNDRRSELFRRLLQAGIDEPTLLPLVEKDALLFLLPDDDADFAEREIAAAASSARHGRNVYLHHVRVAQLPELAEPSSPLGSDPGTRHATVDPDTGAVLTDQILGEDGAWHDTDEPFPIPLDDEDEPGVWG